LLMDVPQGHFAPEAIQFVSTSLSRASDDVHGPMSDTQRFVSSLMAAHKLGPDELRRLYESGMLNPVIMHIIDSGGGLDAMDRHVDGAQLCRTLKNIAMERWGMLAPVVLAEWNITSTLDFGRLVIYMVERGMLGSKPEDSLENFRDVYDFKDAFAVEIEPPDTL